MADRFVVVFTREGWAMLENWLDEHGIEAMLGKSKGSAEVTYPGDPIHPILNVFEPLLRTRASNPDAETWTKPDPA